MKECLVIAFMLGLTGMVEARQSSSSIFDGSRTDSSRTGSVMGQGDSAASDRIMKLDIDSDMINAIKEGQTLEAAIELKDVTNGIVMFWDDPKTMKPRLEDVPRNLKPNFKSGNGVLHFTLDEAGLQRLKTEGLQYSYDEIEKGTYQKVALTYVPTSTARKLPPQRLTDMPARRSVSNDVPADDFGSDLARPNMNRDLSRGNMNRDLSQRDMNRDLARANVDGELPRDDFGSRRRDTNRSDFTGDSSNRLLEDRSRNPLSRNDFQNTATPPTRNIDSLDRTSEADRYFQRQQELARQKELDRRRQLDREHDYAPATSGMGLGRGANSQLEPWEQPRSNKHTFELTDEEIDALASSTQQIRNERERRQAELDRLRLEKLSSDRQTRLTNAERIRLMQELRDRTSLDRTSVTQRRTMDENEFYDSYRNRGLTPSANRLARSASLDSQFDSGLIGPTREQRALDEAARLKLENAALENKRLRSELARAQYGQDHRDYPIIDQHTLRGNQPDNLNQNRGPLRMADFGASIPSNRTPAANRVASANVPHQITTMSGQQLTTAVDHILDSYNGTNFGNVAGRVKTEVATMAAAKTRVDKHNGFLWFLFIMFFALSVYLGWLAQSFYSQYGELADELRETFTATT